MYSPAIGFKYERRLFCRRRHDGYSAAAVILSVAKNLPTVADRFFAFGSE
jgi:hypothetical protein